MKIKNLSKNEVVSIANIANKLNVPYMWLYQLIKFESGFNPKIKNPLSSATGLIQFIDSTAQSLGFNNSAHLVNKLPGVVSQMNGAVYPYLKKFMPFESKQSLYLSVFYPKYRNEPANKEFPLHVQKVNPGIVTVKDYVDFVDQKKKTC